MIEIIYITNDSSINQMLNIENLMSDNINKVEVGNNWIGGEFYIQTCLYFLLEKYFKDKYVALTFKENIEYINNVLDESKIIIFPGWINDIKEDDLQFYKYKNKLYSYTYFVFNFKNMTNLTSHKYNDNTISLYYYKINFNIDEENICFNDNIKGLLLGKCISHNIKIYENIIKLLNKLNDSNIKLFSTLRNLKNMDVFPKYLEHIKEECILKSDTICNHPVLELLGILNPKKFRKLLTHCKYILCLGNPYSPPTIIESLFSNCIVIAPSNQLSRDLHNNKNVYLTDNLSNDDIASLIIKIENDEIIFDKNDYPVNYTEESMINVLNNLLKK